jgi:hypothetical protein
MCSSLDELKEHSQKSQAGVRKCFVRHADGDNTGSLRFQVEIQSVLNPYTCPLNIHQSEHVV